VRPTLNPLRSRVRTARLLLQGLALVYAIAFASLVVQVEGLYGRRGILPAAQYLDWISTRLGDAAWRSVPTLLWWSADDSVLVAACWTGMAAAFALAAGLVPALSAAVCWGIYFSLFQVGRVFLGFQWDTLLLEAGFLAVFLVPGALRLRADDEREPSPVALAMLRWLLFRLMFSSGVVKLLSGDATWWNLTALDFHYWTQPLPTWTAWIVHQFPSWLHRSCVAAMFAIELVVPWFVFGPRAARLAAFVAFAILQAAIAATGNYGFFNLLTVVIALSLVDDGFLEAVEERLARKRNRIARWPVRAKPWNAASRTARGLALAAALPLALAGGVAMAERLGRRDLVPAPALALTEALESWRLTGSYGLFASMTHRRPEIVLEGSEDGRTWRPYPMRWKPGDVGRRPRFVAPHQPRLDWQMWFAALGDWRRSPWLVEVERRLLDAEPSVLALFAADPFEGRRPRAVRAMLYEYEFTDLQAWRETGAWWKRRPVGPYSPVVTRSD
jgi:hypothetical protein